MLKLKPRKTIDDFMRLPEGALAELLEGELLMTPAPSLEHQRIVGRLFAALAPYVAGGRIGEILLSPIDVHLPSGDIVEPDLVFVGKAHSAILRDTIRGVPDLVIEVVSPARPERDLLVKRGLYERNGIGEYWIVTPETRSVEVLIRKDGRYDSHGWFEAADTLTSPTLPGFSLPLTAIFPPA